jgi:hypothetical protein
VLGATTTLTGVNVGFGGTVKSDGVANRSLTVADSGTTTFGGAVGSAVALEKLSSLTVNGGGTTALNGGAITTSGGQTYTDAVVLGADTTLTGVGVNFASTVKSDGTNRSLTVTDSGTTTFSAAVGSAVAGEKLSSLTVNGGGTTVIAVGAISTTGGQTYSNALNVGNLSLTAGGAISASNGANDFSGTLSLNGTSAVIADGGGVVFGATTLSGFLEVVAGGAISQNGILNIGGDLWAKTAGGNITFDLSNHVGGAVSLIAPLSNKLVGGGNSIYFKSDHIKVGLAQPSGGTESGITAARVTIETVNGSGDIDYEKKTGPTGLITADEPSGLTAALTIKTTPGNGTIGDFANPTEKGLRVEVSGRVVVDGTASGDGTIFLIGDDAIQPKYEFAGDSTKRSVRYNGAQVENAQLTGALDAAYLDIRNQTTEIRESGFAKENASKVLRRGVVTSAGPGQPAVDDSTGMAGLEPCDGNFGESTLSCQ